MELSVVFPTRNEEPTIGDAVRTVQVAFRDRSMEVIVADSSDDDTPKIAQNLGARVIKPEALGYGAAYIAGFEEALGSIVTMADPDGTYDLRELPGLVEPIEEGKADLVIGSRLRGQMDEDAMPLLKRRIGNPFLTWLLNALFDVGVSDAHCGMRAMSASALQRMDLRCQGMEFASEMLVEAKRRGLKVQEVPISYHRRPGSPSKLSSLGDGWRHIRYLVLARLGRRCGRPTRT